MIEPLRPLGHNRPAIDPVRRAQAPGRRDPDEERRGREEGHEDAEQPSAREPLPGTPDDEGHLDVLA